MSFWHGIVEVESSEYSRSVCHGRMVYGSAGLEGWGDSGLSSAGRPTCADMIVEPVIT